MKKKLVNRECCDSQHAQTKLRYFNDRFFARSESLVVFDSERWKYNEMLTNSVQRRSRISNNTNCTIITHCKSFRRIYLQFSANFGSCSGWIWTIRVWRRVPRPKTPRTRLPSCPAFCTPVVWSPSTCVATWTRQIRWQCSAIGSARAHRTCSCGFRLFKRGSYHSTDGFKNERLQCKCRTSTTNQTRFN